ncbi:T9SS type A sorting domain-containing protein [candidate division FCPU426 bacterium]|nr:T9SS type A sorting domain-containing protein [candidate division FCPU426 bacterium]
MRRLGVFLFTLAIAPAQVWAATDNFRIDLHSYTHQVGEYLGITIYAMDGVSFASDYFGTVTFTANVANGTYTPVVSGNFVNNPTSMWSGGIQFKPAGDISLTCTGENSASGNTQIALSALPATQLLIFVPGQTRTPGLAPGASPDIASLFDGVDYAVTVYAVDQYWNTDASYNGSMDLGNYGGPVTPNTPQAASNGAAVFTVSFSTTGSVQLFSNTPVAASENVNVQSTSEAWLHIQCPTQILAGSPFPLTATVSTSQTEPGQVLPSNGDTFSIGRFITGTQNAAAGTFGPIVSFTVAAGRFARYDFTYDRAESIYLRGEKISGGPVTVYGINTSPMQILPNVPASIQVTISPQMIQSQHQATVNVLVLDQYGNATRSSLHDFSVLFTQVSGNGYLSVTQTATDNSGYASMVYTGGIINETARILATVRDNFLGTDYTQQTVSVNVSVAGTKAGDVLNYPNPFNPARNQTTLINYFLDEASDVEIRIFDPFGRLVLRREYKKDASDTVAQNATHAGGAAWEWDGKNGEGRVVANGIYLVKLTAKTNTKTQDYKRRVGVLK